MRRTEVNVETGEQTTVDLTPEEVAEALAQAAAYQPPVPQTITRRQCAKLLLQRQLILGAEAVAMTRNGTPPAMVQAFIDALPTQEERDDAEIDFAADNYARSNPLLVALMQAAGATGADIDQFFREAAAL